MMWQEDSGWAHAVSTDLAHWEKLVDPHRQTHAALAIAGPNAWDGSLTIAPGVAFGMPVALFDCTDPARDRVGHLHSCTGLNTTNASRRSADENAGGGGSLGFGDPSFIGIARPIDDADPNLTATWAKDTRGPIIILNETGLPASGYSGPSPIWKSRVNGEMRMVMTYGRGHTGLFCSVDPTLLNWTVCNHMFYPDRDAGGAMFLALPPPPLPSSRDATPPTQLAYTHFLLGVTPGLGAGVAALGIYNDANRTFSNSTGPPPGHDLRALTAAEHQQHQHQHQHQHQQPHTGVGEGACNPCGVDATGTPICCAALAAGYRKATYDAGAVRFGQVWVDPVSNRMTWFAWGGVALLTVVRDLFYDSNLQDLLMYPVPELKKLRSASPFATLRGVVPAGTGVPTTDAVTLFTTNLTVFDVEATIALPASGAAVQFAVNVMAPPSNVSECGAVLHVNVSSAAASGTRSVWIATVTGAVSKLWPQHVTAMNFTLPPSATTIEVRILVDKALVEVFVAKGRGAITVPVSVEEGVGGKGVFFVGGGEGPTTLVDASAWTMCGSSVPS